MAEKWVGELVDELVGEMVCSLGYQLAASMVVP